MVGRLIISDSEKGRLLFACSQTSFLVFSRYAIWLSKHAQPPEGAGETKGSQVSEVQECDLELIEKIEWSSSEVSA